MNSSGIYSVWGGGNKALQVANIMKKYFPEKSIKYFVESRKLEKIGDNIEDIQIVAPEKLGKLYADKKIDGVIYPSSYHLFDWEVIQEQCLDLGFPPEHIYAVPIDILSKKNLDADDVNRILTPYQDLNQMYFVQVHVTDNCNLKCKGCMHFSNLVDNNRYTSTPPRG